MAIDASLYGQIRQPQAPNLLGQLAQVQQLQAASDQNKLAQLAFQDRERALADAAAQREAVKGFGSDSTANYNRLLQTGNLSAAQAYQKGITENQKAQAEISQKGVEAGTKAFDQYKSLLGTAQDPQQAASIISASYQDPVVGPILQRFGTLEEGLQRLQQSTRTPQEFQQWKATAAIGMERLAELAKVQNVNTGGQTITQSVNPATGQVTQLGAQQNTISPDARLQADTTRRGQDIVDTRERELGAASREAQQSVYDSERGIVVNKATGLARPAATMDGKSLPAKLPDSTKKELASIDSQISVIDGALKDVRGTPDAFSFQRGLATMTGPLTESVAGRFDSSAQRDARSYVFNVVSKVINERAGAAQSAQELARLRSFLPAETDNAQQVADKLESFKGYLADVGNGLQAGRYNPQPKPGAGGESAPARITDDAGFNSLPSGALFIGPDGKTRRKP